MHLRKIVENYLTHRFVLPALVLAAMTGASSAQARSFCFDFQYYPRTENFALYDFTCIDPHAVADLNLAHQAGKKMIAYVSVGEVGADAWYRTEALAAAPVKYINPDWGSSVMDVSDPRWADFVINYLAKIAVEKGFDGFFLDTVDVIYDLGVNDPANKAAYYAGMANLIKGLRAAYPTKEIITNRGFEIYDDIKTSINGFLVESLFAKYRSGAFIPQTQSTTDLLLQWLGPIQAYGTAIYIIDYCDPAYPDLALADAARIQSYGFNALVVGQHLDGTVLAPALTSPAPDPTPVVAPPVITSQPLSVTIPVGGTASFSVVATGSNLTYQWRYNGNNIAGATAPQLVLSNLSRAQNGTITVVVANSAGSVTSANAYLNVIKKLRR